MVLFPVACAAALALVVWCVTLYTRGLGWWVLLVAVCFGLTLVLTTLWFRYLTGFAETSERLNSDLVRMRPRARQVQREDVIGVSMWMLLLGACLCQLGALIWIAVVFETSNTTYEKLAIIPLLFFSSLVIGLITQGLLYCGDLMRHKQVEIKRKDWAEVTGIAPVRDARPAPQPASRTAPVPDEDPVPESD